MSPSPPPAGAPSPGRFPLFRACVIALLVLLCGMEAYRVKTAALLSTPLSAATTLKPVKIGYFHGLRIHLLYRAFLNGYFDRNGVDVELYSQYLHWSGFHKVPKNHEQMEKMIHEEDGALKAKFGMVRGTDVIDAMNGGALDGGVVGEASFVSSATQGEPIVAVAMLGHYTKGFPGRGLVLRNDVRIRTPDDFRGKVFATRRSGPGDGMILREFFTSIGLDPENDVTIIDQVQDNQQAELLRKHVIHGLLAHFGKLEVPTRLGDVYLYRKMDWVNPETNFALLVFSKKFLESHREQAVQIMAAYIQRSRDEEAIPDAEKKRETRTGLRMLSTAKDLKLPSSDDPPYPRLDLCEDVQKLLLKHRYLSKKVDLAPFVDRSIVEEAARRVGPAPSPSVSP